MGKEKSKNVKRLEQIMRDPEKTIPEEAKKLFPDKIEEQEKYIKEMNEIVDIISNTTRQ